MTTQRFSSFSELRAYIEQVHVDAITTAQAQMRAAGADEDTIEAVTDEALTSVPAFIDHMLDRVRAVVKDGEPFEL